MNRVELKHGLFFKVTEAGEIPLLDEWCKAVKRWALSNSNRDGYLAGPKRVYPKRSNQQNKAVMGVYMDIILDELGYEKSDMLYIYNRLKIEMGYTEDRINKKTGQLTKVPKQTRDLDKHQYAEWMELFSRNVAVNHGINLPPPEKALAVI